MRLLDCLIPDREEEVVHVALQGDTGRQIDEAASPSVYKIEPSPWPLFNSMKNRKFAKWVVGQISKQLRL